MISMLRVCHPHEEQKQTEEEEEDEEEEEEEDMVLNCVKDMVSLQKYNECYEYIQNNLNVIKHLSIVICIEIGNNKFDQDEYDEALTMYTAMDLNDLNDSDFYLYLNIAYCHQQLNETHKALKYYYKYLSRDREDTYCVNNIAVLEYYNKNYGAALKMYHRMEPRYIEKNKLHFNIGVCYLHLNEFENALSYFCKNIENTNKNRDNALISMAWIYNKKMKKYSKALESYNKLNNAIINVKDLEFDIAWCFQQCHKYADALPYYRSYLKKHENNVNTMHNMAWIYINDDGLCSDLAPPLLMRVLRIDCKHFYANYTYGIYLRDVASSYALSLSCLQIAHNAQPHNVQIMIDIAKAYKCVDDIESAKRYYLKALLVNDNDCYVNMEYAHFCAIIENYKLSHFYYNKVLNLMNDNINKLLLNNINMVESYTNYGHVLHKLNRNHEAIAVVERAFELNPKDCNTLNNLGYYHYVMGDYNEAQKYLTMCLAINTNHEFTNSTMANLLYHKKHFDEAIIYFKRALKLDSDLNDANIGPQILYHYSLILYSKNKAKEAIPHCLQIMNNYNYAHLHKVHYLLAKIYHDIGSFKLALNWIQKAIANKPQNKQYQLLYNKLS